jgi:hypothetical protein
MILACAMGWDVTGKQSNHNQCGQYGAEDLPFSGHFANCRQSFPYQVKEGLPVIG